MPLTLIDSRTWLAQTSVKGQMRSFALRRLDSALEAYEKSPNGQALERVSRAFEEWKGTKGPGDGWRKSSRNATAPGRPVGMMDRLAALLAGADSDQLLNNVTAGIADDFAHTRLGVLYFFSSMSLHSSLFGDVAKLVSGAVGSAVGDVTKAPIGALSGAGQYAAKAGLAGGNFALGKGADAAAGKLDSAFGSTAPTAKAPAVPGAPDTRTLFEKLMDHFRAFATKVVNFLKQKFGEFDIGAALTPAITAIVKAICADAALVVGDVIALAKGAAIALDNFYGRARSWLQERDVKLVAGYPKAVVDGINRAMVLSGLDGLAQMAKSGISIGVAVGASAASPIVNAVLSGAEVLFRFIWRLLEKARIDGFLVEVANHWKNRDSESALHKSPLAFARWYRSHAITVPVLAALTLNSGICGSKMHFLQLFTSSGDVVSQKEFDKGVQLIDNLKPRCGEFIRSSPHKFTSSDPFVASLLASHITDPADLRNGLWAIARGEKKLTVNYVRSALSI